MNPSTQSHGKSHILYDADGYSQVDERWFDPEYWRARHAVTGRAHGRGTTWFVRHEGRGLVLRHYLRGGLAARVMHDRYLYLGLHLTRAWREWHLLERMQALELPVPMPVAARVVRSGLLYRADIIVAQIPHARSLAQRLTHRPLVPAVWTAIGATIRRFHEAGIDHADLNAHNILLGADNAVYIIDFDRGRRRIPGEWTYANLTRLRRSLNKLHHQLTGFAFRDRDWQALRRGYGEGAPP